MRLQLPGIIAGNCNRIRLVADSRAPAEDHERWSLPQGQEGRSWRVGCYLRISARYGSAGARRTATPIAAISAARPSAANQTVCSRVSLCEPICEPSAR